MTELPKCSVCQGRLHRASTIPGAHIYFTRIEVDNMQFGKCYDCRKFVPDVTSLINFWKELND